MADDIINWWNTELDQSEIDAVVTAMKNRNMSQGEVTEKFEQKLAKKLEIPYAVCTLNGTVALLMAYMGLGVKPGDEIIIPNRTFIAAAHAALLLGAKVVLVDTRADIPSIDVSQIQQKITPKTKAIIPTHLNGRSADMNEVNKIAEEHNLKVVEDTSQALFSRNPSGYLGTQSDIGTFSLGMTKFLPTGQGGLIVTKSKELYEKLKLIRNHGVVDTMEDSFNQMGFNFKFNDVLASIGLSQLSHVEKRIKSLIKLHQVYETAISELSSLKLIPVKISEGEVPLWIEVLCSEREKLREFLNSHNIETRRFLPDLHLSPHLQNTGNFPNSKVFGEQGLFLPGGPSQSMENINKVIEVLGLFK